MQRLQLGKKIARKAAGIMMALILMLPLNSVTSLAATNHITANAPDAIELSAGEQYSLTLSNVFTDAEGHTMTYSISNDSGNKSTANQKNGVYYFTSPEAGKYNPIITAECSDGSQKTVQLNITVSVGEVHDINQYGYDETPADEVTVYVTISNDGIPLRGNDAAGTALAHLTVTVPYFDLENYDLQDYYRYPTENGMGSYNGDQVIERPTAMHLFIYMLERYYMGLPAAECGTGEHKDELFGKAEGAITDILGFNSPEPSGDNLYYTGGSTSTYMQNFWGHDENLMYYRNHRYPLMSEGWGATSDYMLLSDGDAIDLAMFSNWDFYTYGKFLAVTTPNGTLPVENLTVKQGESLRLSALQYGTQSVADGGTDNFEPVPEDDGLAFFILNESGELIDTVYSDPEYDESENFTGNYVIGAESLSGLQPGTYKLFSMDGTSGDNDAACTAPATCDLIIKAAGEDPEGPAEDPDWNADGEYIGNKATETIPVKLIIPEGAEAKFFVGNEGKGQIVKASDLGVDKSNAQIHLYEITVPDGSYSCMVYDDDHNYGGVGFDVPLQTSIYENTNLTLALVKFYTTTTSVKINGVATPVTIDSADDFTVNLVAPGKAVIIPGENYSDTTIKAGETYMVAPRMVWAYGNQILYNYTVELSDDLSTNMGVSPVINQTFASTITAIQKKTFSVAALKTFTLTAPTAADTVFYYQINNFNDMVLEGNDRVKSVDNGDGTTTYTVYYPAFSNASYRITEDGYVTAAGYAKDNGAYTVTTDEAAVEADAANKTRTVFLFREDPDGSLAESTETEIASKAGAGSNIEYENSVYLNIDDSKDTNELSLAEGGKFRLRAYRAAWEIVNTVTANIMIEPDFHYEVLYGSDVVSVTPVTSQCTGNAKGNWLDLKAENPGQALIAVWYDAIDVSGNTTLFGTYGATDPARYGYVLVNVGEDYTVDWNVVSHDGDWDAEFDTVYYYGDNGILTIAPEGSASVTVSNVNARDLGSEQTVEANDDGSYDVPVQSGSNLITVTTAGGTDYMLVRAKQIRYYIENVTTGKNSNTDEDFIISLGDQLKIHFDQFNMPVAKMSGIYNPGYMSTAKTMFTLNGQYSLSSVGTQYDYITDEKSCITLTAWVPGENVLSGGFIQSGSMGDNFGNHRNTGDAGRGTNFSAVNVTGYFGSIEDITFNVQDSDAVMDTSSLTALKSGSIFVGESTYNNAGTFTISKTTGVNNYMQWTKTTSAMASQPKNFSLKANVVTQDYYSTLELRYWYDGEEVHTASMIAGSDTIIPWSEFPHDADKILNVQVVVTPGNPELGEAAVYSFLWLPGNANLQYVHPVIKNMTVTAGEEEFTLTSEAGEGIRYTVTDYELDVNGAESITLTTDMLQKYKNATNKSQDNADTVTVQKYLAGEAVGEAVEVYPLTADRYPVGSWTLENVDITGADELKIEVTSYVDETKREYSINLLNASAECQDKDFDGICDDCGEVLGTIKTASVDYTAQMAGAFLSGPKSEVSVDSNLAELYGYTDKVSYLEGVSALDVLVKAHVDLYGESFTAAEKDSYLAVPETGFISKIFGTETSNIGFAVNCGYPNDGTESEYGGYNGTTVTTTSVSDGDLVEFFGYQDDWSSDNYTFTSVPETVAAGETFTANVKGISFGWMGYNYQTPEALKAAAKAIEGISIAAVSAETGAAADLEVTTDEEGNVSLRFDEPGEYLITAYGTDDTDTPVIMTLTKVTVTEAAVLPGDVNGDGSIMADDAAFAYAIANGDRKADQTQFTAADVNEDGVVDASDAAQIYGYANGNIKDFVKSENNDGKEKE